MDVADSEAESTRAFFGGVMVVILIVGPVGTAFLIVFKLFLRLRVLYDQYKPAQDNAKLVEKSGFQFRKVKARGHFVIGHYGNNNEENFPVNLIHNESNHHLHNGGMNNSEQNESKLVVIAEHPDFSQEMSLDHIPTETFRNRINTDTNPIEICLEKNIEDSIVQVYAKKQSNFKKRKVNIFRDNFVPPD